MEEDPNILRLCSNLWFHFVFGLVHILIGLTALILRCLPPRYKQYHKYLGQGYLYGTIIQVSTSLYVRNDGFRWFIYLFLIILVVNLIVGHLSIRTYQKKKAELTIQGLQKLLRQQQRSDDKSAPQDASETGRLITFGW